MLFTHLINPKISSIARRCIIISFAVLIITGCSKGVLIKSHEDLKEVINGDLLDKKVRITLTDSTEKEVFLHNTDRDSITAISYDIKEDSTIIEKISFNNLQNIITHETAGFEGFVIGTIFGTTFWDVPTNYVGIFSFKAGFIGLSSGLGLYIGSDTKINKIYRMNSPEETTFHIGVNEGITLSYINQDYGHLSSKSLISLDMGIFIDYHFFKQHAIQFSVQYAQSGSRWGASDDIDYSYYNLTSLISSVMLKTNYPFKTFSKKTMICAGLFHEYILHAKQKWVVENRLETNQDAPSIPGNFSDEVNKNLYGPVLGIQLPFFFDEVRCQFLWYYSVRELYKNNYPLYRSDFANKNNFHRNMFIFSMDYVFKQNPFKHIHSYFFQTHD